MPRFHADVAEIDQTVVTLSQLAEFCASLLTEIDTIRQTVSASWDGEAFASFQALHAELASGAAEMAAGIAIMHQAAVDSSANYTAASEATRGVWG